MVEADFAATGHPQAGQPTEALVLDRAGELDPWNHRRLVRECLKSAESQFKAIETRLDEVINEEQLLGESVSEFLKTTLTRIEAQKQKLNGDLDGLVKAARERHVTVVP